MAKGNAKKHNRPKKQDRPHDFEDVSREELSASSSEERGLANNVTDRFGPMVSNVREFLEGNPGGAAALGAIIGGAVAGLLASDRGRSLLKKSYDYAKPVLTDYARDFASKQAGDAVESTMMRQ